jgi:hypothetical protein
VLDWETSQLIIEAVLASASKLTGDQAGDLKIVQTACEEELEKKIVLSREIMDVVKVGPPKLLPPDFYRKTVTSMQDLRKRKQNLGLIFERYAGDIFGLTEIARKSRAVSET